MARMPTPPCTNNFTTGDMSRKLLIAFALAMLSTRARAQRYYELTPQSVLEVRGDTVYWMRTAQAKVDTNVFIIRRDSTVRLIRPAPAREVPPEVARYFRLVLETAVENEALRERLRKVPKP